ncbi:MAG: flagellar hook-length control protein FliK [Aliarcobacter sp.]|nr:flagellar hook-length control protein FliK [Aliarcobacter sp.]
MKEFKIKESIEVTQQNTEVNHKKKQYLSLTNEIKTDETKEVSLNTNTDNKLNVLNSVPSSNIEVKTSLMDQLIQKNIQNSKTIITPEKTDLLQKENISKDLISSIYLGSQKNSVNNQGLFNKNEAINLLKDANSLTDVKTSAGMLDLGLENIDVDVEQNLDLTTKVDLNKKLDLDLALRRNLIDNLMLQKNIKSEDVKGLITKSIEASSALLENNLKLADDAIVSVNSPLSYNIQSKIIGAKQQMSTMMSEIAKQMYENYKPPVTVFKINLNPLELGSIAILMKSDKNNALSISMNVSNNSTLDALVENQNILRNSLNKSFDENTKFNLDFSSSNQNNNQSNNQNSQSNQSNQSNQNRFERQMDTQSVLQLKEENKDREEKSIDYM